MKLFGRDLRRRATIAVAAAAAAKRAPAEIGASGTVNLDGFLRQSEYDPDLVGKQAFKVWERMLRSDGSVREAIDHIVAPVKNAAWDVQPASDDPDDLEVAAFVDKVFFEWLQQPWLELLDQLLEFLSYGHSVFELVFTVVDAELAYTDPATGDQVELPPRQFLALRGLEQRLPETIYRWRAPAGQLESIVQHAYKDGRFDTFEIPADRLLVLTHRKRGDEFTGQSLLRSAYKHWVLKELVEKIEGVALERWGVGIPIAFPPESEKNDGAVIGRLEEILANLRGGESSYIVAPGPEANGQRDGYVFKILGMTGSPPDFTSAKNYHRAEIKAAVLARFAELGHASVGARATGDIQSIVWFAALHAVARYIEDAMQSVIRRVVDLNYQVTAYPTLQASGIEERNLAEFADAVAKGVASGAIRPDKSFRDWVRQTMDAPDEDDTPEPDDPDAPPDPAAPGPDNGKPTPDQQIEEE